MRRLMLVLAAFAIPASVATVGFAGPAAAKAGGVVCTKASGSISGTIALKGCNAGLGSGSVQAAVLATLTGPITWKGKGKGTTTITITVSNPTTTKCPTGTTEFDVAGTVTADTSGKVTVGSAVSAQACVNVTAGTVTLLKHTKFAL